MSVPIQHGTSTRFSMIPHWVLSMSSHAVKLYVVLMKYADNQPPFCAYPSRARLARDMDFSQARSVDKYVSELEEGGAVKVERKMVDGKNEVNKYWMNRSDVPWGGAVQRTTPALEDGGVVQSSADGGAVERTTVVRQTALELDPMNYIQDQDGGTQNSPVKQKASVLIPADLVLSPERLAYAKSKLPPGLDPELEFELFVNHHKRNGTRAKDWDASWRTWVLHAVKFERQRRGGVFVGPASAFPAKQPTDNGMKLGLNYDDDADDHRA